MRPRARTSSPSEGRKRIRELTPRKQVERSCAASSRTVKYQWPDAACLKLLISPSTHTDAKRFSSAPRTCEVSSETDSGRRSVSSNSDMSKGRDIVTGGMKNDGKKGKKPGGGRRPPAACGPA